MEQEAIKNIQDIVISNASTLLMGASIFLVFLILWLAMRGIRLWYWKTDQKLDALKNIDKKVTEIKEELSVNNAYLSAQISLQGQSIGQQSVFRIESSSVNIENKSSEIIKERQIIDEQSKCTGIQNQSTELKSIERMENDNSIFVTNRQQEEFQKKDIKGINVVDTSENILRLENKPSQNENSIETKEGDQPCLTDKKNEPQERDIIESLNNLKPEPSFSTNIYKDKNCGIAKDGIIYTREQITATIKN